MIKEGLPGGRRAHWYGSRLVKIQRLWPQRKGLPRSRRILGVCPLCTLTENSLSFLEGRYTGSNLLHHSSQVKARYIGKLHWQKVFHPALADFPICRVYPCRVHTNKHLARL